MLGQLDSFRFRCFKVFHEFIIHLFDSSLVGRESEEFFEAKLLVRVWRDVLFGEHFVPINHTEEWMLLNLSRPVFT